MIDHRGHGYSDKPHDPDSYGLEISVSDVVGVLDELGIGRANYIGYSMGGFIGFGLAKYASERLNALVIGAAHAYERSMATTRKPFTRSMAVYLKHSLAGASDPAESDWYRVRKQANDLKALHALTKDRPDNSDIIPTMTMPCFVYVGEDDTMYEDISAARSKCQMPSSFGSMPGPRADEQGKPRGPAPSKEVPETSQSESGSVDIACLTQITTEYACTITSRVKDRLWCFSTGLPAAFCAGTLSDLSMR